MTDLLPCPFCGSTNLRYDFAGSQGYIECNECGTQGPCDLRAADPICDDDAACDAWNRRSTPSPVPVSEQPWKREGWCDDQGRCWMGRPLPDAPDRWDWSSAVTADNATHCLPHDIPVLPAMIAALPLLSREVE
jgi:Lar family restriction alleviation protein